MSKVIFDPPKDATVVSLEDNAPVNVVEKMKGAPVSLVVLSRHIGG